MQRGGLTWRDVPQRTSGQPGARCGRHGRQWPPSRSPGQDRPPHLSGRSKSATVVQPAPAQTPGHSSWAVASTPAPLLHAGWDVTIMSDTAQCCSNPMVEQCWTPVLPMEFPQASVRVHRPPSRGSTENHTQSGQQGAWRVMCSILSQWSCFLCLDANKTENFTVGTKPPRYDCL